MPLQEEDGALQAPAPSSSQIMTIHPVEVQPGHALVPVLLAQVPARYSRRSSGVISSQL
jgi:hypothetical protein